MEDSKESRLRAEFEAAMRQLHPEWSFSPDPVFGYHNERTRCAWDGYRAASASRSEILEALKEILSIEPMSPEGGHEAVAEIHRVARAALAKYQGE